MRGTWHLFVIVAVSIALARTLSVVIIVITIVWLLFLYKQKRINYKIVVLLGMILFLPIGNTYGDKSNQIHYTGEKVNLHGEIVSEVKTKDSRIDFVFKADNQSTYLVSYFLDGYSVPKEVFRTGAECSLNGKIRFPDASSNPGQFNYQTFLINKGIQYQLTMESKKDFTTCTGFSYLDVVYRWRSTFINKIDVHLSSYTGGWLKALVMGEDEYIDSSIIDLFQRWGLSHLLAISGLHVGLMVTGIYYLLVNFNLFTKEKAKSFILLLVLLYPLIGGGAPSIWRASLMTGLGILLVKFRVHLKVIDIISIVFLVLILVHPKIVNQLGFQFSFLVSFCLIMCKDLITNNKHSRFIQIILISFISTMCILPLQVHNFYFFNPLSIPINLLIVPYFSFLVIPLMFLLFVLSFVMPSVIPLIDNFFQHSHGFVVNIIEKIDKVFYYPWIIGEFPIMLFIPYYVVLMLMFIFLSKNKQINAFFSGILLTAILVLISAKPYLSDEGTVTMLDVGQGDSIVIELPYRESVIVIDLAGSLDNKFKSTNKVYEQVIKPFLYARGISTIDKIILTHQDHDHIGSFPYVMNDFKVKQLVISESFQFPDDWHENIIGNTTIKRVIAGDVLRTGKSNFFILQPGLETKNKSTNENSLVIFSKIGGLRWLFTGDIDEGVESLLLYAYPNLKTDVLKIAHHGSGTSTSESWIDQIAPKYAWISVGDNNSYGHPDVDVLRRLEQNEIIVLRTDKLGAIQYNFSGNKGTHSSYRP